MTGGIAVTIGEVGKNFAAGMSGGIAYAYDPYKTFASKCNQGMVLLETLDKEDEVTLQSLLNEHQSLTGSVQAEMILQNWPDSKEQFIKIIPRDYKQMLDAIEVRKKEGLSEEQAIMAAFDDKVANRSTVS